MGSRWKEIKIATLCFDVNDLKNLPLSANNTIYVKFNQIESPNEKIDGIIMFFQILIITSLTVKKKKKKLFLLSFVLFFNMKGWHCDWNNKNI